MFCRMIPTGIIATTTSLTLSQTYPQQALKIMVPFPAGGTVDILERQLSDGLTQKWDVPVIVDNKAGARGAIGLFKRLKCCLMFLL